MKTAFALSFTAAVVLSSLSGCGLLKKKDDADAGVDASAELDAATVTVTGTGAKNEANILRYASETALANEAAVIAKDGTIARNFPGNGPEVATLAKGTAVAKIAQYFSTGTLVMFDDPSGDGTKLLGWVMPTAFDLAAPPPEKPVVVPPRVVVTDGGARPVDGGTSDAGMLVSSTAGDAGAGDAGTKAADAGAAGLPPAPPRGAASANPVNGKCPADWFLVGGTCRSKCNSDADCAKPLRCIGKRGAGKICIP